MHELKRCNSCGNLFPSTLHFCLNDGSPLADLETLVGITLDGRYRLDDLIGTGGMGDVYRATHVHLDTEFAVKLLKPEFVANQTAIKRFRLEAKAAGRIHHPNAIRVTDFGVTSERIVYLVMEIVEGQSLRSMIREEEGMPYQRTVNIVRQICAAVEAAHRGGVIHRDLKPDNILIETVNNMERVKVLDFGIAKLKETKTEPFLTQAGTIIGTPQYMSPEQCQGKALDPRSDVYSIGVILYEMLTGRVPFDGDSTIQIVFKHMHEPPQPFREIPRDVPDSLAEVVMRALEKDPDKRQASAAQLGDELKAAVGIEGEDAQSFTDSLVGGTSRTGRRTPVSSGRPTEVEKSRSSASEDLPWNARRETAVVSPAERRIDSSEIPAESAFGKSYRGEGLPVTPAPGRQRTRTLLMIVAAALVVIAGIIAYLIVKPAQPVVTTVTGNEPAGMVLIPAGKFTMGRNDGEPDEGPTHEVEVKAFYLDLHEVTNQDYEKFVIATGRAAPKHWKYNGSFSPAEAASPVTFVTWEDASAYAAWAHKRLPTEEEWEYAARGGAKELLYPWGNEWQDGFANVNRQDMSRPASVDSFEKDVSPFGIRHLAGNVSEWVQNNYSDKYGAPPNTQLRVYRGGNFIDDPKRSTNTYRWADYPYTIPDNQLIRIGFRCAKDR